MESFASSAIEVGIVSANADTLASLETYLRTSGLTARTARALEEVSSLTRKRSSSRELFGIVLFPDDFNWKAVLATLAEIEEISARRPQPLFAIVVTAQTNRFLDLTSLDVLILPRPAWGWTILDLIRAQVASTKNQGKRLR